MDGGRSGLRGKSGATKKGGKKKVTKQLEGVMKAVVREGSGVLVEEGHQVVFHCTTRTASGHICDSTRAEHGGPGRPRRVVVGESRLVAAVEHGLCTMREGEVAMFKVEPSAHYGDPACPVKPPPGVPAGEELQLEVEVVSAAAVRVLAGKREKEEPAADGTGEEGKKESGAEAEDVCGYAEDECFITKQTIEEGRGWEQPRPPYEVKIRLEARPLGSSTPFYAAGTGSSPPLHLALGAARLPPALDLALSHMLAGEKAVVFASSPHTIPPSPDAPLPPAPMATAPALDTTEPEPAVTKPEAGTAEAGRVGLAVPVVTVPAPPEGVVDVEYHVELVKITQVRDVLGNGCVIKRRLQDGTGDFPIDCPLQDSVVHIHVRGTLPDQGGREFMDTRKEGEGEGQPLQVGTGEGRLPEALEASIRLMLPGEVALVSSTAQYAYESFPRPEGVPEGARVQWEVELFGFEAPKGWEGLSFEEILAEIEHTKQLGNTLYKEKKYTHACSKYERLLREMRHVHPKEGEEAKQFNAVQVALQLNVAACQHGMGEYARAMEWADKVLTEQPNHSKALYRRGLARMHSAAFDEARADFQRMVKADSSTQADAAAALAKLKKMEEEAESRQRRELGGLFDRKPGSLTAGESPAAAAAAAAAPAGAGGAAAGGTGAAGVSAGSSGPAALSQATCKAVRRAAKKAAVKIAEETGASIDSDNRRSDNEEGDENGDSVEGKGGKRDDDKESELIGAFNPVKRSALLTYGPAAVLVLLLLAFGLLMLKDVNQMRGVVKPVAVLFDPKGVDDDMDDFMDDEL
ncbi:hypothetical protein CLOP_g18290 [Closterium sp. NIES-67]|nr:hypothetical protein CLOP_g18290 [Closterium sp. NIES-67]